MATKIEVVEKPKRTRLTRQKAKKVETPSPEPPVVEVMQGSEQEVTASLVQELILSYLFCDFFYLM